MSLHRILCIVNVLVCNLPQTCDTVDTVHPGALLYERDLTDDINVVGAPPRLRKLFDGSIDAASYADLALHPNSSSSVPNGQNATPMKPTTRLFHVLFKTVAVVLLGAGCKLFGVVHPEKGHMQAFGFFVGRIAFPLLIFKVVAAANIGNIKLTLILACTLGKLCTMVVTWTIAFVAYHRHRTLGQRVLTATVLGSFCAASNDFAFGFPVIDALYGPSMEIYLSANALAFAAFLQPLIMVMFGVGKSIVAAEQGVEGGNRMLQSLKEIVLNPITLATLNGVVVNIAFSRFLIRKGESYELPHPLSDVIDLITVAFPVLALFMLGVSLSSPNVTAWTCFLVLMKVIVCGFVSYAFSLVLGNHSHDLQDFSFFYGSLPTSITPLVYANEFDRSAVDVVATSIVLALSTACPNMFVSALFLSNPSDLPEILSRTWFPIGIANIFAGLGFIALLSILLSHWVRSKSGVCIAVYGFATLAYAGVFLYLIFCEDACVHVDTTRTSCPMRIIFNSLQKACVLSIFYMQYILGSSVSNQYQGWLGTLCRLLILLALSFMLGVITSAHTLGEVCGLHYSWEWPQQINHVLANALFFGLTAGLAIHVFWRSSSIPGPLVNRDTSRSEVGISDRIVVSSESSVSFTMDIQPAEMKTVSHLISEEPTGIVDSPIQIRTSFEVSPPEESGVDMRSVSTWYIHDDGAITIALCGRVQALHLFLAFVNSWAGLFGVHGKAIFTQMIIIECLMEHGQLVFLVLIIIFFDSSSRGQIRDWLSKLWGWLRSSHRKDNEVFSESPYCSMAM